MKSSSVASELSELPKEIRGRPVKIGDQDHLVQKYILNLRECGGIVNRTVVRAAAIGILRANGALEIDPEIVIVDRWARSILERMGFSKRKGTKAARHLPPDFEIIKETFLKSVKGAIEYEHIPSEMVVNFDQTGAKFVPTSEWTMARYGSKQVPIIGLEDKREMTILLGIAMNGSYLPPQLIYAGKTEQSHPHFQFPDKWDVTHTESHWSTTQTMHQYLKNVLLPYFSATRERLNLPNQKGLVLFDVFKAHRDSDLIEQMKKNDLIPLFVPASCTSELQPLDLTVNSEFKRILKSKFITWYADQLTNQFDSLNLDSKMDDTTKPNNMPGTVDKAQVNLKISVLKPLHAKWLVETLATLQEDPKLPIAGFRKAGILPNLVMAHFNSESREESPAPAASNSFESAAHRSPPSFSTSAASLRLFDLDSDSSLS